MLPLSLLRGSIGKGMLVELKNGETYNGHLVNCDHFMNINMKDVICTSRDGDKFWKIPSIHIRGTTIKYLCIPDEVMQEVQNEPKEKSRPTTGGRGGNMGGRGGNKKGRNNDRGGRGGRGRGMNQN